MMRTFVCSFLFAAGLSSAADANAFLWREPAKTTIADWIWGPGGESRAPLPPFTFVEEDRNGTNPKLKVEDAKGDVWIVKFGGEDHGEVFAGRLLYAMGYAVQPSYFVRSGVITGAHGLKRTKAFIGKQGEFAYARFKLHEWKNVTRVEGLEWSWTNNPFVGSHELNGLKILMMLLSNWDAKDSRNGKGSNTAVYSRPGDAGDRLVYAFDDWGATLGKWGGFFSRDKWNVDGFSAQSREFVSAGAGETIRWGYRGKHGRDLTSGIRVEDVRWLLTDLSGVSDDDVRAGLRASGATADEIESYTRSIRRRVTQLQRLCGNVASTR